MNRREKVTATLACGLAGEIVRTFGQVRLHVSGTSMAPSILTGDLISVQRAAISKISSGETVLYSRVREGLLSPQASGAKAGVGIYLEPARNPTHKPDESLDARLRTQGTEGVAECLV